MIPNLETIVAVSGGQTIITLNTRLPAYASYGDTYRTTAGETGITLNSYTSSGNTITEPLIFIAQ